MSAAAICIVLYMCSYLAGNSRVCWFPQGPMTVEWRTKTGTPRWGAAHGITTCALPLGLHGKAEEITVFSPWEGRVQEGYGSYGWCTYGKGCRWMQMLHVIQQADRCAMGLEVARLGPLLECTGVSLKWADIHIVRGDPRSWLATCMVEYAFKFGSRQVYRKTLVWNAASWVGGMLGWNFLHMTVRKTWGMQVFPSACLFFVECYCHLGARWKASQHVSSWQHRPLQRRADKRLGNYALLGKRVEPRS